jgi:hypothetical protein
MDKNNTLWIFMDYYFLGSLYVNSPFAVTVSLWYCRKGGVFHVFVEEDFFPSFLSAIFKPTRRNPVSHPGPERLVSDSGTKATPLLGSENYLFPI